MGKASRAPSAAAPHGSSPWSGRKIPPGNGGKEAQRERPPRGNSGGASTDLGRDEAGSGRARSSGCAAESPIPDFVPGKQRRAALPSECPRDVLEVIPKLLQPGAALGAHPRSQRRKVFPKICSPLLGKRGKGEIQGFAGLLCLDPGFPGIIHPSIHGCVGFPPPRHSKSLEKEESLPCRGSGIRSHSQGDFPTPPPSRALRSSIPIPGYSRESRNGLGGKRPSRSRNSVGRDVFPLPFPTFLPPRG